MCSGPRGSGNCDSWWVSVCKRRRSTRSRRSHRRCDRKPLKARPESALLTSPAVSRFLTCQQAARLKKLQEQEKQQKVEFRKRMEKEVSDFIQDSRQIKKKFQPMNKIERSILHDVVEVAGLTSFSFGEDDECRYVMIFKKEFAPSDEELESYRRGEEWDPQKAEEKRKLKELAQRQEEEAAQQGPVVVSPASDYKDKYSHLIGKGAAKDAAHMLQANKTYGCVPVANKRDTRSIEEAMNEIRAKKRLRQSGEELPPTS
ncbi:sperm-associated antigen 7 isoform X1 [Puma concolor]|uniref:Sperm-associated antigen 7 isoform X1 n=2 Tax=Puma concolor TaxID=9696 RepID=A0A6P6HLF6_PUMCO|nr:sperm-associated antigen 7 isoform X1 [Puma concolor]